MTVGQTILTVKSKYAIFLVLGLNEGGEDQVREALEGLSGRVRTVGSRNPDAKLSVIAGIGSQAWDRLFTGSRPKLLRPFKGYEGDVHSAPSTPGDILLHIKAQQMDLCYEVGQLLTRDFGDAVHTIDEVHGFRYFDLRDLTGFVDGTENPVGDEAVETILVAPGADPNFAGGSYITTQRYVTDFEKWNALPVAEQENVFGRSKTENIEMDDEVKPSNSHTALNVIEEPDGTQLKIVRDNMPYGDISGSGEKGTFFIAYARDPEVTGRMLENMFIGDPVGNYDRLLDFSTAVTGNEFFAPDQDFLDDLPPAPGAATDGSLGIGSLRQ